MLRHFVAITLTTIGTLFVTQSFAITLVMTDVQSPDYPTARGLEHLAQEVRTRANGQLEFKLEANGRLGSEIKTLALVREGKVAITRISAAGLSTVVPEMAILTMPFLFRNALHQDAVVQGPIGVELFSELDRYGLVGLAYYSSGSRSFYTTKKPIRSIEDLKGLKIRVQQSELADTFIRSLNAVPVSMPNKEVMESLSKGTIDGAENTWASYVAAGHFQAAKYYTLTEHVIAPDIVVMSKQVWQSLTPVQQSLIKEAAERSAAFVRVEKDKYDDAARQTAIRSGVIVTEMSLPVDRQPFVMAVKPLYKSALTTSRLQDLERRIRATRKASH